MARRILKYKTKEGVVKYRFSYKDFTSDTPKKLVIDYCTKEEFASVVQHDGMDIIQIVSWPKFDKEEVK